MPVPAPVPPLLVSNRMSAFGVALVGSTRLTLPVPSRRTSYSWPAMRFPIAVGLSGWVVSVKSLTAPAVSWLPSTNVSTRSDIEAIVRILPSLAVPEFVTFTFWPT